MEPAIMEASKTMLPHEWWMNYGSDYPTMQPCAIRLCSQVLGSGDSERNWRDWDAVKTRQRCSLGADKANKLVHIYCSKKLKDMSHASAYQALMKEWADMNTKLGIGGEDHGLVHKREFHAFPEDWEGPAVLNKDANSQRRLEKKYRGLYIFDKIGEESNVPYHAEITSLEWLNSGRNGAIRWSAGWRVSVVEVQRSEDGLICAKEGAEAETYEVNQMLINLIIASPHNTFVALLARSQE